MRQKLRTGLALVALTLAFQTTAWCQQDVPESAKKIMSIFQGSEVVCGFIGMSRDEVHQSDT